MHLYSLASKIPLPALIRITGQKLVCPTYHSVSDLNPPHLKHLYRVRSSGEFEHDLDFLLKYYTPLSYDNLLHQSTTGIKQPSFFLSFDDGFREIYDVVLPILKRKGVPAMVFLNTGFVDNHGLMYRCKASILYEKFASGEISKKHFTEASKVFEKHFKRPFQSKSLFAIEYKDRMLLDTIATALNVDFAQYLRMREPYLTSAQVNELLRNRVAIGAHSVDHPLYSRLTFEEQCRQTEQSLEALSKLFPNAANAFAFPFTDFGVNAGFFEWLHQASGVDTSFGVAGLKQEARFKNHYHRIPMEKTSRSAHEIIAAEYLYFLMKAPFGKNSLRRSG